MAFITPKTDWSASDGVTNADMNRIEGNIAALEVYDVTTTVTLETTGWTQDTNAGNATYQKYYKAKTVAGVAADTLLQWCPVPANGVFLSSGEATAWEQIVGRVLSANTVTFWSTAAITTQLQVALKGVEFDNISDLSDYGDTDLHYHAADRNRANHTGTQNASTVAVVDTNGHFTGSDLETVLEEVGEYNAVLDNMVVDVKKHGAAGLYSVDDTAALQAVFSATAPNTDIYFPYTSEVYLLNSGALTIPAVTRRITGANRTTIKTNFQYGGGGIVIGDGNWVDACLLFENLSFIGNVFLELNVIMEIKNVSHVIFRNCKFDNGGLAGLLLDGADLFFENCYFTNNNVGLSINCTDLRGSGLQLINCHFQGNTVGIKMRGYCIDKIKIDGGVFQGNDIGIDIETIYPGHILILDDVYFEYNTNGDMKIGNGEGTPNLRNLSIKNCQFVESTPAQSIFRNIDTFVMENNYFGSGIDQVYGGFNVEATVTRMLMTSNRFEGKTKTDIAATGKQCNNNVAGEAVLNSTLIEI